jgi:hypothetical protein
MPDQRIRAAGDDVRRRWRRFLVRVALAGVGLIVGALAVEFGYRAVQSLQGRPFDARKARTAIRLTLSQAVDLVPRTDERRANEEDTARRVAPVWHPILGYDQIGGLEQLASELPRVAGADDPDEIEILIVGGSVSTIFADQGAPLVVRRLEADPRFAGKRLRVSCYGRGGHKQPQQLGVVNWLFGFEPELVLNLDGFNEVALSNQNARDDVHPAYPSSGQWASLTAGGVVDRTVLDHAARALAHQNAVVARAERALALGFDRSYVLTRITLLALNRD